MLYVLGVFDSRLLGARGLQGDMRSDHIQRSCGPLNVKFDVDVTILTLVSTFLTPTARHDTS